MGRLKRVSSIDDLEIDLDLTELEEMFVISALVGYMTRWTSRERSRNLRRNLIPLG